MSAPPPGTQQKIWDTKKLFAVPQVFPVEMKSLPPGGRIRALTYEGEPYKGKPTRVFAWIGVPDSTKPKLPGIVLVHGGGGTAYWEWVKLWMDRGYVAIAMDTCGFFLTSTATDKEARVRNGFSAPDGGGGFFHENDPVGDQWMYHAVADVILGHSLLRSEPRVDPDRIGLTGISWGGVITNIVAGIDHRFKFAAPVYGCGFLGENSFWLHDELQRMGRTDALRWLTLWDPSQYVENATMPLLFCDGTNDKHFRMDSWQKTYREAPGPHTLSLKIRMKHGHAPAGDPPEITVFADSILQGGAPLAKITGQGRDKDRAWATYASPVPVTKVDLVYTKDGGDWMVRDWKDQPAGHDAARHRIEGQLPEGTTVYYFNLTDSRGCIVSTEHEELGGKK